MCLEMLRASLNLDINAKKCPKTTYLAPKLNVRLDPMKFSHSAVHRLLTTWHGSTPALVSCSPIGQNPVVGSAAANHSPALTGISSNQMTSC